MELIVADKSHLSQIQEFISAKTNVFKIQLSPEEIEDYKDKLEYKLNDKSYQFILAYENKQLTAMMSVYYWKTLPYFCLGDLFYKRTPEDQTSFRTGLNTLIEYGIQEALKNKYYVCYFITRMRRFSKQQFLEKGNPNHSEEAVPALSIFDVNVEFIIPKNSRPAHESYWHMMGSRTHDCDLWVRRGTLKVEKLYELLAKDL